MSAGHVREGDYAHPVPHRSESNPLDGWTDYPADPSGDVDTDNWLGWINVSKAPYIWSYALNGWIYMDEPAADTPGAWVYFFK